jgi:hypothetical protein
MANGMIERAARALEQERAYWRRCWPIGATGWHIERAGVTVEVVTSGPTAAEERLAVLQSEAGVRAVIAAMREPTEAMIDGARDEMMMDPIRSANVFQVMIDAALKE